MTLPFLRHKIVRHTVNGRGEKSVLLKTNIFSQNLKTVFERESVNVTINK